MAKENLLAITQEILSDMNSDNVNSISDTIESQQVAQIIKRTFLNLYNDRVWPHVAQSMRIDSMSDNARPTHMKLPDGVQEILWVKYDIRADDQDAIRYRDVEYKKPQEFLTTVMGRDADKDYAQVVIDIHGAPLIIHNNHAPTFYTSFDDEHLVFDSFDNTVDGVLQQSKVQVFGYVEPPFVLEDAFVPDLPSKYFPYFVNEAKSTCFLKIKEVFSQKDEQNSTRQKGWLSREKRRVQGGIQRPNYGRKPRY